MSRVRQQLRLSIFSLRNNIESSQLKIKCDDVFVLAKFLLSTAFSTAMSSAGEARLTDKILKGFFSKPPCCTHEFPFLSICFFLSHTLIVFLSLSLSLSLKVYMCICLRARAEQTAKVFFLSERIQSVAKSTTGRSGGLSAPIKKDIRVIRISTREVSVSEGGTFEK